MGKIIEIEYQQYSIDWLYQYKEKFDLDVYAYFDVEHRLGNWYLIPYKRLESSPWFEECYMKTYELSNPVKTVAEIQKHIKGYRILHNPEMFPDIMIKFMQRVKEWKVEATTEAMPRNGE